MWAAIAATLCHVPLLCSGALRCRAAGNMAPHCRVVWGFPSHHMPIVLPCRPAHVHVPIVLTDKPPLVCSVPYVVSGEYPITAATGGSGSSQEEGEQKEVHEGGEEERETSGGLSR